MQAVVITGITRGVGYALARRFAGSYAIVGCGRNPEHLQKVRSAHPDWDVQQADLADPAQAEAFAAYVRQKYPHIALLVNNAGAFREGSLLTEPPQLYEEMLRTNLHSAYHVTRGLLPVFLAQKKGLIVLVSSIAAFLPYPRGASYAVAKAGLRALGRNLRYTLKDHGVAVTTLLLGATYTDSWAGTEHPPERFIPPEAVADLVWAIAHLPPSAVVEELVLRPLLGDL
ncbi:MAG: oxidoreductase [Bacteroidia bacterium]|nr:MAG: oxidoreductase [Bacteroidia bacterium]